tara:strand:- start:134 stop:349 length:216 start_codon:yes stop_codon:yes gene_type:complete
MGHCFFKAYWMGTHKYCSYQESSSWMISSMHMTGVLQKVIENNRIKIDAVKYDGKWGEVDSEDDLGIYKYD